jgi:hypothetical protein
VSLAINRRVSDATPDTTKDMMIDKQKQHNNGANLAGVIMTIPES